MAVILRFHVYPFSGRLTGQYGSLVPVGFTNKSFIHRPNIERARRVRFDIAICGDRRLQDERMMDKTLQDSAASGTTQRKAPVWGL